MDWLLDRLGEFLAWLLGAAGLFIAWLVVRIHKLQERVAVLEKAVSDLPADVKELKKLISDMREESSEYRGRLYDRIEALRLEMKADINREADKRKPPWN